MTASVIPTELEELLQNFTISVLEDFHSAEHDLIEYAANYFNRLRSLRSLGRLSVRFNETSKPVSAEVQNDEEFSDEDKALVHSAISNRRCSVAAESYDPEKESDDENAGDEGPVIVPKTDEQRSRLKNVIKDILLFRCLDDASTHEVVEAMAEKRVEAGATIIQQNDEGNEFYVVGSGSFSAYKTNPGDSSPTKVMTYDGTGYFGELALMYNTPRAATVKSDTSGVLWTMDGTTFRRMVLKKAFKQRKRYENFLRNVALLSELSEYERVNLADAIRPEAFEDGDVIFSQGDVGTKMYIVEEGNVKIVRKANNGEEKELCVCGTGEYFGELALITHKVRFASAVAVGKTTLSTFDVDSFERLMGPCLEIMRRNFSTYEASLAKAFGDDEVSDLRGVSTSYSGTPVVATST